LVQLASYFVIDKKVIHYSSYTFIVSSVVIAVMALTGKIQMETSNKYSNESRTFIYNLSGYFRNPIFDILIVVGAIAFIYFALKQARKNTNEKSCH